MALLDYTAFSDDILEYAADECKAQAAAYIIASVSGATIGGSEHCLTYAANLQSLRKELRGVLGARLKCRDIPKGDD